MIAEIITIGDELLYGSRIDTNSAFLGNRLDGAGIDVRYMTSTGDNMEFMIEAISLALRRADIVITTGGLGPTDDDITKNAICKVFKRNLIFHEDILERLQLRFSERGLKMPAVNQNQALLPQGAKFLPNKTGSALGIIIEERGKVFCSMPGVPHEMRAMTDDELIPRLQSKLGNKVIQRHKIRTIGISEAALSEKIRPALKFAEGVSLAYLPSYRGVDLCIKGVGTITAEVESGVELLVNGIRRTASKYIFTEDDRELEEVVGELLLKNGLTLAVAESCTGGMLGSRITRASGSSGYFAGGIIAYSNEVKTNSLGVPVETINRFGAVSAETAKAMAAGVIKVTGADVGISVTGIAGPTGGTDEKPVGTIFLGLATTRSSTHRKLRLGTDREINRERSVSAALNFIRKELLGLA
ncbi:MAG: competence/damage-inducible protein A [candidate division Zixibacteria bacterium]|nr:competence/damage-inducible protein A [candidate division Zixibacteria bacterium]